ncbi:MAG: hypothetical protein KJ748_15720, partial [Gammaproteobacteria bacterium]|nr:hypothetical protein [Gammaproteobacteria bacterium]
WTPLLILSLQIQYGVNDAYFTRGVHLIIPIGSTAASMPPTVTVATMPILINPIAVRLAKKLLPQSKLCPS